MLVVFETSLSHSLLLPSQFVALWKSLLGVRFFFTQNLILLVLGEMWRSYNKKAFVKALQRLVPEICVADLIPAPAGIRAQAVTPDGGLADDFLIENSNRIVNVCNAPSPAATASLNIGKTVVERLAERF